MATCSGVCNSCRKVVALVVKEASSLAIPALTTAAGAAIGASSGRSQDRFKNGLLGLAVGGAVGLAAAAFTPVAQKWVCGECGCSDVTPS